jgi:hypothetical protein
MKEIKERPEICRQSCALPAETDCFCLAKAGIYAACKAGCRLLCALEIKHGNNLKYH